MNDRIEQYIAVMQAYADGKEIEFRRLGAGDVVPAWLPCLDPLWQFADFEYRLKSNPKQVVLYTVVDCDGDPRDLHASLSDAEEDAAGLNRRGAYAPYRVVKLTGEYTPDA